MTRRSSVARIAWLIPLSFGYTTTRAVNAAENGFLPKTTGLETTRDLFCKLWTAAERHDLRLAFLSEEVLQERIQRGVYAAGAFSDAQREHKADTSLTVEGVLKARPQKRLNQWKGAKPSLVLVKKDQIKLGEPTREFLGMSIQPGDVLIIGGVE